jgi:RNA polymerase sigma factor, sigma-70 family
MPQGGMKMDHRQEYPERDELRAKFTRWLETVIRRAKIDYLRKYENRPETISYEDIPEKELIDLAQRELWPSSTRMQTPYDFEEERLTKAFMELPLKRRQVMELLFLADLSETETAKRLNCSLQYVRNQRCIALKKLRSRLMEGGDDE